MDRNEFIKALNWKGYSYEIVGESIVVTHKWSMNMHATEIPKGVVFDNEGSVYLDSLTELPEGTVFKNKGWVSLGSLAELPKETTFQNKGRVYLESLKKIAEGTVFKNEGCIIFYPLSELYDGAVFENEGGIYAPNMSGKREYLGEERLFETVDGLTMLIEHQKVTNGYTIKTARYFGGGPIEKLDKGFIAEKDGITAHGSTVKEAIEDLQLKLSERTGIKELVEAIKRSGRVTLDQFRHITGACREGTRHHLAGLGIVLDDISDMALAEALAAMEGTAFGETFKKALTQE